MRKQEQHKRFTKTNERLSSLRCYWYVQPGGSIVPITNANDDRQHQRPEYVHELVQ